ncbi:ComEC/Rec2 family competence protein [Gramella sp. KN1008]|uniref:ComEC/Rec2 family competence protein n=1 Tax=Gramella sp. KN1008 TaxID=2529298 RepID=UPI00103DED9E|nr:ComEC/Rec2 family competence protein [Gramella sp. KN1008]TBW28061.1 ComEC family competence protein [Gramella sp. KN1008]
MKNFQFIFLRFSIYLIAGIICAYYFPFSTEFIIVLGLAAILLFILAYLKSKRKLFPDLSMGIATLIFIFALGLFTAHFSIPSNQPGHYLGKSNPSKEELFARALITEELKPTNFSKRYLVEIKELVSQNSVESAKGKLLLNLHVDSSSLKMGDEVLIPWRSNEISRPLNPFQFNYRSYMQKLGVERQISITTNQLKIIGHIENITSTAWNLREQLITELQKYNFKKDEMAVFQALILGQRRDITDELYKYYAAAGAIHILAISGLHIGILLLLLNFILKPVESFKKGKYIKPILVILLLWSFALLTGLSPSVVRAVCMFSFLAIGLQMNRKTSTLNSLFVSMFFLLLINPRFLFQAGFQLSYLAVFSIIVFQPPIYRLLKPKIKVIDYFWKIISVSLAAQIGVLPLSLYYFHQFPGLFLASNLVVLPLLGIILGLAIMVILMALIGILPDILAELFGQVLSFLNSFIHRIANIDSLVFSEIDLSLLQCLTLYLCILGILLILVKPNFARLCFLLTSILLFQLSSFYNRISIPPQELVVFHKSRESLIGKKQRDLLYLFKSNQINTGFIKDYIRERKIENIELDEIPGILSFSKDLILVIDTAANYKLPDFKPEIIIVRNSPRLNMDRLIQQLQPGQIIADGSNYLTYVERWRRTCNSKKIPFHHTGEKGAFIFSDFRN